MNPACENPRKGQDCISRNARTLCKECGNLLTPSERQELQADRWVSDIKKHADYYMQELKTRCLTPAVWRRYSVPIKQGKCISVKFTRHLPDGLQPKPINATCVQMQQKKICPGCVAGMSDKQLKQYWLKLLRLEAKREEQRQNDLWAQAWAEANGWPFADPHTLEAPAALAFGIFMVANPCFMHGWECAA